VTTSASSHTTLPSAALPGAALPLSAPGGAPVLPGWAVASEKRRGHIARVTALLDAWSDALGLAADERQAWHDAGRWHDALRDADDVTLRSLADDPSRPLGMLHGSAAARLLARDGETRADVLDAIRWHTTGWTGWERTGRALYMADFLEPGRPFMQADRAFLANLVPHRFDAVFRQVVRLRLEWALREGKGFAPETVALWDLVR
jgi:2-amino-4-hydroxy-6-hydroxymethyldihydropteridine diphosphokinase